MRRLALVLCLLASRVSAQEEARPDPFHVSLAAGAVLNVSRGQAPTDYLVRVEADGPLVLGGWNSLRLGVRLDLTTESGQRLNLDAVQALEFEGEVSQRISKSEAGIIGSQRISTSVYAAAGFAALRGGSPLDDLPSWAELGLKASVQEKGKVRAHLRLGLQATKVLDGDWQPALSVSGSTQIPMAKGSRVKAALVGDLSKAIGQDFGGPRWQIRLGVMLAI